MVCPKCGGVMRTHNRSGVAVEACDVCGGMFLDYGELEALKQREGSMPIMQGPPVDPHAAAPPQASAMLHCPKCGASMRTYKRSGVSIEQCDHCRGIYLDHGEIEALKQREPTAPPGGWPAHGPHYNPAYYHHPYHRHPYYYPRTGLEFLLL